MKRVLVAPLDWGLGHATRCIPLIRYLLGKKVEVIMGADGRPFHLLSKEFPDMPLVKMPGYAIRYPDKGFMLLKIASQIPAIYERIKQEHKQLKGLIKSLKIDAVISDNRFGLWSEEVPCVFITHQLRVKSPIAESFLYNLNMRYISRFSECWIPDVALPQNKLSGDMSSQVDLPAHAQYIGLLSRFTSTGSIKDIKRKLLVILSGPEPQRTLFEKIIIEQLKQVKDISALVVQGITERLERKKIGEHVELVSYLKSDELLEAILSSEVVLSRSGYSTIMDLAVLGKKAIFVPTPGQTEQEYLANYLSQKKMVYAVSQSKLNLEKAYQEATTCKGFTGNYFSSGYQGAIDGLLENI